MNTNKITIYVTIVAIILIIACPTFLKVLNENHRKLYIVSNKLITEAAERCYYQKKCDSKIITLKQLYELKYLEEVIDPVSKEVYNSDSYVEIKEEGSTFTAR